MSESVPENVTKSSYSSKYQDKTPEQSFSERALFVFNICYDTTEGELKELFHRFGPAKVKLMMTEHLNKNRGHAFVEYQDPSHAKEAVKHLNGYSLQDTKIKVQFNTKQPPWYAGNGHNNRKHCDNPPSNSVYVRNLDNSITSEDLEGQFSRFSPLKVSLVIDHVTKRNKGYAFVDFSSIEDAANAIKHTNGAMFYGRQLHVEFSNRSCNLDSRKSESISSLNSDLDDLELMKLRQDRERLEDELSEKKTELEDAKAIGCEDSIQLVREHIWRLQDDIARIKLAEDYPPSKTRARSQDKRKKKRRSDEGDQYYSDERENTPGIERSYTPTSFGSRRSHHRGSISSNSGDDGYLEHRVFVGGLNHTTTPETFKGFFSKFGKISSYFLKWDKISGRNKGFGFVSYDTAEQMESLLATHKESSVVIDNHAVNIKRVFPESYVSPFPLNIPPMLCRAAPHFTDPPPYCDERNPLPDDQKIVEFFYNLGIHHYNLLRINVYHWNLLFPGNMFSNAKMDSAPPTRQPSPAPPPFPAPPAMPVFSNLDQQHRPATHMGPMMPTHLPTQRTMYPQQNSYPRHSNPMFHDMMIPNKFYNKNQKTSRPSTPQLRTAPTAAGIMPSKPVDYIWEFIKKYPEILCQKFSSNHRGSHQFNNSNNKSRGMGNNFHNNNNNYLNNFHHNNYHNNNNNNNSHHNSHTNVRNPLDSLQQPIRLQQHDRRNHLDHSRPPSNKSGPDKVTNGPPVSFSPTHFSPQSTLQPFSPEIFSPSKVTNSPAHSSPPQPHPPPTIPPPSIPPPSVSQQPCPVEEGQNNSSYGSHEDTLTFESTEQADQGYTPGYQPPNSATLHKPHPLPVQSVAGVLPHQPMVTNQQCQTNLPQELTLSPPPSVTRPLERSRSSSGSYSEGLTEKGNTIQYTHSEKGALPQKPPHMTPNQPNIYPQIYQNLQPSHRHQVPPRLQQEKHMKSEGTQPPVQPTPNHITEELNKMHRLRNLPQPGPNFHGPVHGGGFTDFNSGDKNQRLDTRSPGIPPGYSSIPYTHAQLLSFLHLGQMRPNLLPQTMAGLIPGPQAMPPHPLPPHTQSRYHDHSPPPSEDESEDDSRQ